MFKRNVLASAVIIASIGSNAQAQLEEVLVTATKQSASTQDIPIAVTALGQESLEQLGIANFSDYLIQLPGVTAGGSGPGQNTIYIRGVASTTPTLTTAGVAGLSPNVALYLDEQPLGQPGRNLDVYAADLARVEVLAGPQGTLYGASSQAGTVRLITNKPDPSGFSGKVKFGTAQTKSGDPSNNAEGVVNIPLSDNLTVRAVVYVDNQGGYIDNVAGTVDASASARFRTTGTPRANGVPVSDGRKGKQAGADLSNVNFLKADNASKTEENFNATTYAGNRFSALWRINQDWDLLVSAAQQTLTTDGVFFSDPELGDLEIQRYEPDSMKDEFENYSWTLEGRIAELDVVYTGAFTDRETDQLVDYTDYLFVGQYIPYYICDASVSYPGAGNDPSGTCQAPNLFVQSETETQVETHEIRFSTDQASKLRATVGAFYSDLELREVNSFTYPGSEKAVASNGNVGFGPNRSAQGASTKYKGVWAEGIIFRNDVLRTDEQTAVFGDVTYDINHELSTTIGARYYDVEVDLKGSAAGSFSNFGATSDKNAGNNLDELFSGPNDTADSEGVIGKVTFTWVPNNNVLYYATWSEGFRSGILNRPGGSSNGAGYTVPFKVNTDEVTNYELGWKSDFLNGSLRFNGSIFMIEIEDLQTGIFDPNIANLFFVENAANAEVKGIEGDVIWRPYSMSGLTMSGGFSILDTEVTDVLLPTKDVVAGDELAFAPGFQANIQARYEWSLESGMIAHVMPHVAYSDEVFTDIITINRMKLDSWVMVGITAGVSNEEWTAEVYVDNLTDERAEVSGNFSYDRERITTSQPLNGGFRFSYNF